jgi:hypothetical protein
MSDGRRAQWTVLPFGYNNTLFDYQNEMGIVTDELKDTYTYVDDCLICSENKVES